MKPATPLPWKISDLDWRAVVEKSSAPLVIADVRGERDDAAYIVHACNAYPKLVEALRRCAESSDWFDEDFYAMELLRELGEIK